MLFSELYMYIFLPIVLIAVNALISAAQTAVISINDSKLAEMAASGNKKAEKLKKLTDKPSKFLSSVSSAFFIISIITSSYIAAYISVPLYSVSTEIYENAAEWLRPAAVTAFSLIFAFLNTVFGKIIPEKTAAMHPEKTALRLSGFIGFVYVIFVPFSFLSEITARILLKLVGINPDKGNNSVTEEEILMMSDAGAENGTIDEDENRIIKNVFAFDDMTAGQICTHRTDASILWEKDSIEVWEETIHRTRHSSFPICGESIDNIIGILNAKDYFRLEDKSRENIMSNAVREPYFVHENMKADRLFAQMKKYGAARFAVVVDEYGGMSGIITVTDLVEQLVGDFDDDELDEPERKFEKTGVNTWLIPGITPLSEVAEELEIKLPADKYDTFGGYAASLLGEIPKDGSKISLDTDILHIDITEFKHRRVEISRVTKIMPKLD
ncbi:MAG: HlyC/CorC family transporter [Ruminococcus sp.]|nr:HlyC/CorC family transporter [Ruminococcus sp.]